VEPVASVEVRDLAGKSEALLRQLRELEDTASKRTPEQLARERYALELEAAQTFLALDEAHRGRQEDGTEGRRRGTGFRGNESGCRRASGARRLARVPLGHRQRHSAPVARVLCLPAGEAARAGGFGHRRGGDVRQAGDAPPDAQEAELQAAVSRNPTTSRSASRSPLYVERQEWMRVWNETTRILERSPNNPRALAYQALVRLAMGQGQAAVSMLTTGWPPSRT